jgi:DNA adenine methylase
MKLLVYRINGFGAEEQKRLRRVCDKLSDRGCQVLISNSATLFIKD